jgi:acetolactate synthase-1/2/3 large subunit
VIHVGADPLFARYPLRGFRTDLAITGMVAPTLAQLAERIARYAPSQQKLEARRKTIEAACAGTRRKARSGAGAAPPTITGKWFSACLNKVLGEDALLVNEYPVVLEEMELRTPGRFFGTPPSGGLGWGVGAALGAKLASPDRTVVCALGDGAYMFGNPTAGHFVSEAMRLPVLYVIFNNARWAAVHRATLSVYPKGVAAGMKEPPFATLEPSPRFEHVVQASGGHGERVTEPGELLPALQRAMKIVREEKRQALVNVCAEAAYVKTS